MDAQRVALGVRADGAGLASLGHEVGVLVIVVRPAVGRAHRASLVRLGVVRPVLVLVLEASLIVAVDADVAVVSPSAPLEVSAIRGGEASAAAERADVLRGGGGVRRRHAKTIPRLRDVRKAAKQDLLDEPTT